MKRSVYTIFMVGYFFFIAATILFINYSFDRDIRQKQISSAALSLYNTANGISDYYSEHNYDISNTQHDYTSEIKSFMFPDNTVLWIVSTDGTIYYSSEEEYSRYKLVGLENCYKDNFFCQTDFGGLLKNQALSVYSPIVNTYKTYGYVILNLDISYIETTTTPYYNYIIQIFVVIVAFSLIFLLFFYISVFRPLSKLRLAASAYAQGNFDYKDVHINSKDEFQDVYEKIQFMAHLMKDKENDQKKFIANISHDFRSPLTSIKGYLEAMQDGTIPPELYDKYINTLLFETERLTKLTGSLLLLNTWDGTGMKLEQTSFDIVALTRNIVASFEVQCLKKRITMDLYFGKKEYFVYADQTKIQQVIYNLVDNAIKFSNNDSTIKIGITDKNEKIFVSVKDYGIGIPRECQTKIFNRFYKTDYSRGKDKTGSGLGLSIVKEIITSHNENINVISTENVGTEFIFTLPKSKNS